VDVGAGGDCAAPVPAVLGVRYIGVTEGAGALAGSCGAINGAVDAPEAVFAFAAPRAGQYCATTAGSRLDTALYARAVCDDAGTELACSDDAFDLTGGPQGALTFAADFGQSVVLIVDGFALPGNGDAGPFVFAVTGGPCAPL
ncbi:MAG: hypothetical protein KC620_18855, partial [Myxococcales bacterium]|nr:hypothetical protein [Myxococcales bacterium]